MKCDFCGATDKPTENIMIGEYCEACLEILNATIEIALERMKAE